MAIGAAAVRALSWTGPSSGTLLPGSCLDSATTMLPSSRSLDLDFGASVAGPVAVGQELHCGATEPHRVVVGHGADVLEAEDGIEPSAGGSWR